MARSLDQIIYSHMHRVHCTWLSAALETGSGAFETMCWLKRQSGEQETGKNKRSAKTMKR